MREVAGWNGDLRIECYWGGGGRSDGLGRAAVHVQKAGGRQAGVDAVDVVGGVLVPLKQVRKAVAGKKGWALDDCHGRSIILGVPLEAEFVEKWNSAVKHLTNVVQVRYNSLTNEQHRIHRVVGARV